MRPITELQEIKDIVLSIMTTVHNYCEENKITYYLAYGTLLGAVRHNGFIPWDDDIDIWMPRPDYELFLKEFPAYGKTHNLFLSSYVFPEHYFPADFTKVCRADTILNEGAIKWKYQQGVFIDVFPLDGMPDKNPKKTLFAISMKVVNKMRLASIYDTTSYEFKHVYPYSSWKKFIIKLLNGVDTNRALHALKKMKKKEEYGATSLICANECLVIFQKDWFSKRIFHPFENQEFYIPNGYENILAERYGADYMTPPPVELQKPHHIQDAWIREK